jgi:ABC transporter substrate binding protein
MGARSASWTRSTSTSSEPSPLPNVGDPVGTGIVASLARPGGNVTGLSLLDAELDGKRIELLKEAVPYLRRLAVLWSANDPGMTLAFGRVEMAAKALGFPPEPGGARTRGVSTRLRGGRRRARGGPLRHGPAVHQPSPGPDPGARGETSTPRDIPPRRDLRG